jgi:hypothetical protein
MGWSSLVWWPYGRGRYRRPVEYTPTQRALQDRFDTRRIADRINGLLVQDTLDDNVAGFIATRDVFFLATVDADGQPTCSYKSGDPGFVRVLDPRTPAFPRKGVVPPVPDWKRADWACDYLPAADPARGA